jgi:long-chain acyl-CoA synthetase
MVCVAHPVNFPAFVKKSGLSQSDDLEALCKDDKVVDAALKELNSVGKKNGLKGMELLESIVLTEDEWTPETGFLTAAQSTSALPREGPSLMKQSCRGRRSNHITVIRSR